MKKSNYYYLLPDCSYGDAFNADGKGGNDEDSHPAALRNISSVYEYPVIIDQVIDAIGNN